MNTHQGKHVGQNHHTGPDTAHGRGLGRHPLNHARHGHEVTVPVRGQLNDGFSVGQEHFDGLRIRPFGYVCTTTVDPGHDITILAHHGVVSAGKFHGDNTDGNDAAPEQNTLNRVNIGHGPQARRVPRRAPRSRPASTCPH